ncbi:tumor necrosis factor alpha-induced protein 2 [Tamandua tetradactyla]|uniref:tumor necrosis factor alpha-induced protein 2 n=1 Tax=Tamandua tetradactyla TaxID=48850 RepID=UPI0040540931
MLKMMTTFQGFLGNQPVPGDRDFSQSPPQQPSILEAESEASMSEASSEDLVPPLEVGAALERDEEATKKEKKKSKGLANMFSIFTKGRKKKKHPSPAEPEAELESDSQTGGPLPSVEELKADLEHGRLDAAWPLLVLERELLAAAAAGGLQEEELVQRQSKVEALYVLLRAQVLAVLRRPLDAAPERLRQALAVVAEQEREDRQAAARPRTSVLMATRPRSWLQLWRREVARLAEERLARQPAAESPGRSEAERAFLHLGRTMREDLEVVVERLKPLFPAEFNVVATYAESYHEHFAAHLATMAQFELCERDTYMLLVWVKNFYPNDVINSPKLASELQGVQLGSLLPPSQIQLLEATFLSNEAASVKDLMARALELESQHWVQDVGPQRLDGRCHSELAIDVIQIISQGQAKAETITPELGVKMKQVLLLELAGFLRSYQRAFDEFLEKCKPPRNFRANFRANVMANINNCLSFRTSIQQNWQTLPDALGYLLGPLNELKSRGFDILLQNLFAILKPLFKRFTQTHWADPAETLERIISAVGERLPEFLELQDCFREELTEAVHLHLVKEYLVRLSKRSLVLKTAEQQQQLAKLVQANGDRIQHFCLQHGSQATWLGPALPMLAEVIRLQDPSAIKIAVATYATQYPDFSKDHLSAILAIKGNLSSSDVKSIRSILDVSTGEHKPSRPLFSLVKLG